MLSSQQLADVISASLEAEDALANAAVQPNGKIVSLQLPGDNKGQVDAMFRGFLASDPLRYFLNGVQIPGLFETNFVCPPSDPSVGGNWCLTVGDKIEVPLQLVFRAPVTVLSVQDNVQNPSSATPDSARTTIIGGESATFDCTAQKAALANVVPIRLQITCGKPSTGSSTGSTSSPSGTIPLTVAASSSVVFYTNTNSGPQTAMTMAVAGGTGALTYSLPSTLPANFPGGVAINANTGILTYTPTGTGPWGKWALPVTVTDTASTPVSKTVYTNVSFDDGNGASNNNSIFLDAKAKNAGVNTFVALNKNPLYASLPNNGVVQGAQTLVYASPPFASSAANSATVASSTNPMNLTAPLSVDELTITYTFPAAFSLSATEPAVAATKVKWSITSQSGRSGPGAPGVLPAGFTFDGPSTLTTTVEAKLKIDLSSGTNDYSPGNAAGNVPGVYKFLITTVDENQYIQSFPVSINIAVPSPTSAVTPLTVSTGTAALNYVNGAMLTYSKTGASVGGVALPQTDTISIVSDVGLDGNADHTWTAVPVGTGLPGGTFTFTPNTTAGNKNKATVAIDASTGSPTAGAYPYLISALDASNIVQTIFFTINIVA